MTPLTIDALVADGAARAPDAVAMVAPDRDPLSYAGLAALVEGVAAVLSAAGIGRGDRVALIAANGPEAATAFLGLASAAIVAPLNPGYRREELEYYLTDLRVGAVVVQDGVETPAVEVATGLGLQVVTMAKAGSLAGAIDLRPLVSRQGTGVDVVRSSGSRTPRSPDDVALLLHTSGTTARPKLVPLTHGRLVSSAHTIAGTLGLDATDRCLNVMPLFHIHGLVAALLSTMVSGGSFVAAPGFVAPAFYGWLDAFAPTWYTAVPTIHQAVLGRAEQHRDVIDRRPLRFIRSSSASLPVSTLEGLEAAFRIPVVEAYGMTEASHQMASNPLPPGERKPGSVGRATGIEITILGSEGSPLPIDAVGEVAIRGATIFDGYEANPDANATSFVDGWFRTGDQGALDHDGYLHLNGRLKELINRGGEKIAPVEVEDALLAIPGVAQAVVFAIPDARLGEEVAAAVVLEEGAPLTERTIQATMAERLADFKVPRAIAIVPKIPVGATGKVQRIGMAERLGLTGRANSDPSAHGSVPPRTAMERDLAAIWVEVLGVDGIGVTDDFFDLGGDSMLAAMIVTRVGDRLGHRDLPLATFLWAATIERYARGLETGSWGSTASPLLPIQPEGGRPPFFFVHIDDRIIGPAALRRTLDPDQPLYGLRAMDLDGGSLPASIDGLAAAFKKEVLEVQPEGPYFIGGFCSGGRVALEMARSLQRDGADIGLLVLVDPRIDRHHDWRSVLTDPGHYVRRVRHHLRRGQLRRATINVGREVLRRPAEAKVADASDRDVFLDALARARRAKRLEHYPGSITILHSRQYEVPRAFWDGMADRVSWTRMPVDHETIFQGDDGATFATRLSETLRMAEGDA